jgi:DNA helicase-2/ATP-dependent DNA helicase PcrA
VIGLDHLNPEQKEAVVHPGGPLLVLAGAGSGKTGVITHRIAWLVSELGVPPWNITAVTFTNKAAAEMRERVEKIMGGDLGGARIGTFHSMCLRILRQDGELIGLKSGFNIYDATDQVSLVRKLLKDEELDEGSAGARAIRARISRAKNRMESPESMERKAYSPDMKLAARIYGDYDKMLRRANAVDFDDILLRTLELFREHPQVLEQYAGRCHHLLVDEYQDTNRPQYLLVRALSSVHGNLFVVGDEDQSIYRFRGAEIRNILDFEQDHPGAKLIRLEQNYRSSGTILAAAGAVIANNLSRKGKKLWTENDHGERLTLFEAPDDRAEAVWAAGTVRQIADSCAFEDIAILYRTNAQSRQLEEIFRRDRIPYQVVGSTQFYERKEIKDLLGYLKLAANPADDAGPIPQRSDAGSGAGGGTAGITQEPGGGQHPRFPGSGRLDDGKRIRSPRCRPHGRRGAPRRVRGVYGESPSGPGDRADGEPAGPGFRRRRVRRGRRRPDPDRLPGPLGPGFRRR